MLLCVSWGGWKDGATCWGAVGTWELVGSPLCPVDAEQHCSPSSVLGPDHVSCADSVGLCLGDEMRLKPIVGNKWVLFTAGKEVWKYSVKWWGEKALPWRKPVSPRKTYRKLQLCKHGQFPQQNYRPSSPLQGLTWQTDALTSTNFLGNASFTVCFSQSFKTWLPSSRNIWSRWSLIETGWWSHLVTTAHTAGQLPKLDFLSFRWNHMK